MSKLLTKLYIPLAVFMFVITCGGGLGMPSLISPKGGASSTLPITAVWSSVENAHNYKIEIDSTKNFTTPVISAQPGDTTYTITTLSPRSYYWHVAAIDAGDKIGDFSNIDSFRVEFTNPVHWWTNRVNLEADHFYIVADSDTFYANTSDTVNVSSDPGDSTYCTLEMEWFEKNVEMRLFVYFYSDGTDWWSDEFRTYNGKEPADWVYYYGTFFKSPLGSPFTGNFEQQSDTSSGNWTGKVHFTNLKLQAFLNP